MQHELAELAGSIWADLHKADNGVGACGDGPISSRQCASVEHVGACGEAVDADEVPGAFHGLVPLWLTLSL